MQVKKFEAKSMKDALTMVKQELGPEAIILSAKDNKKSYGLAGKGSIEVTAAISEKSLNKKQFTESRLPESSREKFRSTSAKHQRQLIETTVTKYQERRVSKASAQAAEAFKTLSDNPHRLNFKGDLSNSALPNLVPAVNMTKPNFVTSGRRYIDILDDDVQNQTNHYNGRRVDDVLEEFAKTGSFSLEDSNQRSTALTIDDNPEFTVGSSRDDLQAMRREIESLRGMLSQYQNSPAQARPVTQHPGAEFNLPFELAASFEKLSAAGIDTRYIVEILEKANRELSGLEKKKKNLVDAWVARYLLSHISVSESADFAEMPDSARVHLFVGPAGHGKTSSLVNFASQMVMKDKKRVAIASADTYKVGATEQLKIYAQILGVPFVVIKSAADFQTSLAEYAGFDAVLVDYPGLSLKDAREVQQLKELMPPRELRRTTHLVLSSAGRDLDTYEATGRYQVTQFSDIIMTRIDESTTHGLLYNIQRKTEKPLFAFGLGSKISEDFELATRERVLDLIYKISQS